MLAFPCFEFDEATKQEVSWLTVTFGYRALCATALKLPFD